MTTTDKLKSMTDLLNFYGSWVAKKTGEKSYDKLSYIDPNKYKHVKGDINPPDKK